MATDASFCLAAVIAWFSRKVLAWRLSITLGADSCMEAFEEALARHGQPELFTSDQGSQFTSVAFIKVLKNAEVAISMDGKGAGAATTSSSSGSGGRSSTRRCICAPTPASSRPGPRSAAIRASTPARGRIRRLAGRHPIRPISASRRQSRPRRNQGGDPLSRSPEAAQTNQASSPLTEIAREGARRMLATALEAEVEAFVCQFAGERLPDGRQRVVRHGHGPERKIQTGIGALEIR